MVSDERTIDVQLLRVFVTVAKRAGVTAAAESLGVAKSAVSKQLSTLESALQVRLFERASRQVALTREGQRLLPRAESVLAELDQFVIDAQDETAQVRGMVRIAASPEFGAHLARYFVPGLLARHAGLKVAMSLEYPFDDLHDPGVDLAFRLGSLHDDRLVARSLGEFSRVLVCSPEYARLHAFDRPADLERANALLFADRELMEDWALQGAAALKRRVEVKVRGNLAVRGFEALAAAAVAGLGVARLPSFVAAPRLADGSLLPVLPGWQCLPVPVYLAYRPGVSRVGRVRAVIDAAMEEVPGLLTALPMLPPGQLDEPVRETASLPRRTRATLRP